MPRPGPNPLGHSYPAILTVPPDGAQGMLQPGPQLGAFSSTLTSSVKVADFRIKFPLGLGTVFCAVGLTQLATIDSSLRRVHNL